MKVRVCIHAGGTAIEGGEDYGITFSTSPRQKVMAFSPVLLHGVERVEPGESAQASINITSKYIRMVLRPGDVAQISRREGAAGTVEILFANDGSLLGSLPERLPQVEPDGDLVPALLFGYDGLDPCTSGWDKIPTPLPRCLVTVEHQAGGYAMSHPGATGVLFRLAANQEHALQDPAPILQLMDWMAEDPSPSPLRKHFPQLNEIWGTWGKQYEASELQLIEETLRPYYALPKMTDGLEAFVGMERSPSVGAMLDGWKMVTVKEDVELVDCASAPNSWGEGPTFGADEWRLLRDVGRLVFGTEEGPRLFLLWENSD